MGVEQLIDEVKIELLQSGGVDNWSWYSESISAYVEMNGEIENDLDILYALEMGGVDNWDWYGESLGNFYEWTDHAREFFGTDKFIDFYTWDEIQVEESKIKANEAYEKAEREKLIKEEEERRVKIENDLKEESHIILYNIVIEKVGEEKALQYYTKLVESESFWSGLRTPVGQKIVDKAKKKAEKHIKDNKLPFNMINFMPKAREFYVKEIIKTDEFKTRLSEILED